MNTAQAKLNKNANILSMVYISLFTVLIIICAYISIPITVPFTLQTFAVFATLGLLGGKKGSISVLLYMLLGAIGLPVFAGFKGGLGVLLGPTGGYIIGFLFMSLLYWLITKLMGTKLWVKVMGMLLGLLLCYTFGTAWFLYVYANTSGAIGLLTALSWCVFPFILPDLLKLALAAAISKLLYPFLPEGIKQNYL